MTFKTEIGPIPPTVITNTASSISYTKFTSGGNVTSDGGAAVTARGVIWSLNPNPTISLPTKTINGVGLGIFNSYLFDLTPNTTYYVVAYATNSAGTSYGKIDTIKTRNWVACPTNTADIDGNKYNVVTIGYQCWTQENLKVSKYRNGDVIPNIVNNETWASLTMGLRCWYENDSTTYEEPYGNLYNWYAATDSRGVCPTGWHVPTDEEWTTLVDFLGGEGVAGGKMKVTGSVYVEGNVGATNSSGFTGYPGGYREVEVRTNIRQFDEINLNGIFWSSDVSQDNNALLLFLRYTSDNVFRGASNKGRGYSIRCIRD